MDNVKAEQIAQEIIFLFENKGGDLIIFSNDFLRHYDLTDLLHSHRRWRTLTFWVY
jgi:ADP-glucose pyrophosphorylase